MHAVVAKARSRGETLAGGGLGRLEGSARASSSGGAHAREARARAKQWFTMRLQGDGWAVGMESVSVEGSRWGGRPISAAAQRAEVSEPLAADVTAALLHTSFAHSAALAPRHTPSVAAMCPGELGTGAGADYRIHTPWPRASPSATRSRGSRLLRLPWVHGLHHKPSGSMDGPGRAHGHKTPACLGSSFSLQIKSQQSQPRPPL